MSDTYEQVTGVPRTFLVLIGLMTAALVLGLLLTDRASDRSVVGPDPTTPEPQATGESGEPELLSLSVRGAVTCSGSFVAATVTWTTVNTDEVAVHVDGRISEAAMSPRGHTEIGVPCDGSDHSILVVASGADGNATLSHEIVTAPLRDPDPPKVISFSVASPAQCNGTQALVAATWSATSGPVGDLRDRRHCVNRSTKKPRLEWPNHGAMQRHRQPRRTPRGRRSKPPPRPTDRSRPNDLGRAWEPLVAKWEQVAVGEVVEEPPRFIEVRCNVAQLVAK